MTGSRRSAVDSVVPRARRTAVAVAALLVVVAVIAAAVSRSPSPGGVRARRPVARLRVVTSSRAMRPSWRPVIGAVPSAELRRARQVAGRFLAGYLSLAYGHSDALAGVPLTTAVRNGLRAAGALVAPAARRRHPRVVGLVVVGLAPGFVVATATIADGGIAVSRLRFALTGVAGRWVLSGVLQGG
jgi:hypothetical protein